MFRAVKCCESTSHGWPVIRATKLTRGGSSSRFCQSYCQTNASNQWQFIIQHLTNSCMRFADFYRKHHLIREGRQKGLVAELSITSQDQHQSFRRMRGHVSQTRMPNLQYNRSVFTYSWFNLGASESFDINNICTHHVPFLFLTQEQANQSASAVSI